MSLKMIPWRLIGYIAAGLLILAGLNHAARFVPFTPQWSAHRAEAKADRLEGQVSTLEREATGNAEIGQAVETFHTREVVYRDLAHQAKSEAENAPDGETPLSDERGARLHGYDVRVCDGAAFTCSAIDAASGRTGALPSDGSPVEPDAG
ncbi:MAG: hypothetical protein KKG54_07475 [Alphaproteobacteria bacterium]|nr:hypothetical protein [Alphaproteobacteria bacterium]MBU4039132.1 hypothetical protein [Alphaproteobacteria bacterium]MBU4135123.1 hypothetical protein [Alphaproteobacteria bacterium]